jgi:phage-related protein
MPQTTIRLFRDHDGEVPFLLWLEELEAKNRRAFTKCLYMVDLLRQFGSELRRPQSDLLRDGVYELRTKVGRVNYRVLYGFVGKDVVLVSHGITKEREVPAKEIEIASARLALFKQDPARYSATVE